MIKRITPIIAAFLVLGFISPVLLADDFTAGDKHLGGTSVQLDTDGATSSQLSIINAENYDAEVGTQLEDGNTTVGNFEDGDYLRFDNVDMDTISRIDFRVAGAYSQGSIEVRLDSVGGTLLGTYNMAATADWDTFETRSLTITETTGTHSLYLVASSAYTESGSGQVTIQAEDADTIAGGATVESNNAGFNGTGFANFPTTDGYIEFANVQGGTGGSGTMTIRRALGEADRSGDMTINGSTSTYNCVTTGSWTTYADSADINMTYTAGATNTIRFTSTGNDYCNFDELTFTYPNNTPARVANLDWIELWGADIPGNDVSLQFGSSTGKKMEFNSTNQEFELTDPIQINASGEALRLGDGSSNDHYLVLKDAGSRSFGWDDSDGSISTFGETLRYRLGSSSSPPGTCGSSFAYQQWMDSDTGTVYICDTSNGRNKWLSVNEFAMYGEESAGCAAGADPGSSEGCNLDFGNSLGPDTATDLGFYLPNDITVTGYGYSEGSDECTSGSFDIEVWGTGSASDDNTHSLSAEIVTALDGQTHNSNALNVDVNGGQYALIGLDNNCGQSISNHNAVIYYRYRHD